MTFWQHLEVWVGLHVVITVLLARGRHVAFLIMSLVAGVVECGVYSLHGLVSLAMGLWEFLANGMKAKGENFLVTSNRPRG